MPRNLNVRQEQFAASVAAGKTKVAAYREAYKPSNGRAPSVYQNAKRTAKHPLVAERIEDLKAKLLPDPGDVRALHTHAMGVMVDLSLHSRDDRVRYQASAWIREETGKQIEEHEKLEGAMRPANREEVLGELRKLFERHLPERVPFIDQKPLVLEAANEEAKA